MPDGHCWLIPLVGTFTGRPEASQANLATSFCIPVWFAVPQKTASISSGLTCGLRLKISS
jgi:hypothetical protein